MKYLVAVFFLLYAGNSCADSPLVYTKTILKIIPAELKPKILETNDADKKLIKDTSKIVDTKVADLMPRLKRATKEITVAVRPLSFLEQRDFIAIQPFTDKEGMLMLVGNNEKAELKSSNLLGKTDILFISPDGIIEQIAPEISIAELDEPLTSTRKIRAFVFLKSGMITQYDIKPGDRIENQLFKTHPIILE